MLRKLIQVSTIVLVGLTMEACDSLSGQSPDEVLNNYLEASLKRQHTEAYSLISDADKKVKDLQTYLKENEKEDNSFARAISSKVSFTVRNLETSEKNATAEVEITLPDFGSIFADVMGAAFKSALSGSDDKEMARTLAGKLENGEVPMTTKEETYRLVKETGGWKVFLDWETEVIEKERQAKTEQLLAEAEELKKSKKLNSAVEKYLQILELDSEVVDAKEGLKETKSEIKSFEKKQAYIGNVELYDLSAKYHKTYLKENVPGVVFKLKNKGDKTLNEVVVTVYFKDANGTIIAEEDYHPVLVTQYSFGRSNKPLKPNYVWQMERGKFYQAESVPSEWREGAVSAKITNIEFE